MPWCAAPAVSWTTRACPIRPMPPSCVRRTRMRGCGRSTPTRRARAKACWRCSTAQDIKAAGIGSIARHPPVVGRGGAKMAMPFRPVLAETAMHVGDLVAMVVADSQAAAQDAADLVQVDYEELTPVVDLELAMKASSNCFRMRPAISASTGPARCRAKTTSAKSPRSSKARRTWRACASSTSAWWWPRSRRAAPPANTTRRTKAIRCAPARRAPMPCAARPLPSWACRMKNCASSPTMSAAVSG